MSSDSDELGRLSDDELRGRLKELLSLLDHGMLDRAMGERHGLLWLSRLTADQRLALRAAVRSSGSRGPGRGDEADYLQDAEDGLFLTLWRDVGRWWPPHWNLYDAVGEFTASEPDNLRGADSLFDNKDYSMGFLQAAMLAIEKLHPERPA